MQGDESGSDDDEASAKRHGSVLWLTGPCGSGKTAAVYAAAQVGTQTQTFNANANAAHTPMQMPVKHICPLFSKHDIHISFGLKMQSCCSG
jgi:hypothetical protein